MDFVKYTMTMCQGNSTVNQYPKLKIRGTNWYKKTKLDQIYYKAFINFTKCTCKVQCRGLGYTLVLG